MDKEKTLVRMRQWDTCAYPTPGPEHIVAFLTNKCNLNCHHCWRQWCEWDRSFATELPDERWLRLVEEAASLGTRYWSFLGGGEPLIRRDLILDMIRKALPLGMTFQIHTNGILFTPRIIDELMELNLVNVIFSLDGPNAQINNQIRGSGFDKALANLRYFSARKKELSKDDLGLMIYATITNLNYNKINDFVELAASMDSQVILCISALVVEQGETLRFALTSKQKRELPYLLNQAIVRAKELGVKNNFQYYLDTEIIEDSTAMQRNVRPGKRVGLSGALCYEPWLSAAILPNGQLGPCCAFYDPKALSIKELSLQQVWTGLYMNLVREGMFNGKPPGYCVRCPSNLFVDKEITREFITWHLRRDHSPALIRFLMDTRRGLSVLRDSGPAIFIHKLREWMEVQLRG